MRTLGHLQIVGIFMLLPLLATSDTASAHDIFTPPPRDDHRPEWVVGPDAVVRVQNEDGAWTRARFLGVVNGDLRLAPIGGTPGILTLPANSTRMQIRAGSEGHALQGLVVGLVLGATTGAVLGSQTHNEGLAGIYDPIAPVYGAMGGAVLGGFLGGMIGASIRTASWADTYCLSKDSAMGLGQNDPVEFELVLFQR